MSGLKPLSPGMGTWNTASRPKNPEKGFNISRRNVLIGHSAVENCVRRCTEGGGHIALNSAREMLFCGVPPSGPDRISPQISKDIFIKLRDLLI